eukprot:CAMPEP_0204368016 /NCGR_PEP_ID=MMETSP0469-20131031/43870_1 /ASSEMBLY_ACC=CAM_ASM_000384 /TAXON_ID=2969 /ORGANISM="Oxyrrhis marina" /LENGTH=55 /DNA_ID=CAMNT_0051357509 /DNA_START=49 /DNA_END=212 /DNA_ORIENTATION=-
MDGSGDYGSDWEEDSVAATSEEEASLEQSVPQFMESHDLAVVTPFECQSLESHDR